MSCVSTSGMLSRITVRSPPSDARSSPLQELVCSPSFDRKVPYMQLLYRVLLCVANSCMEWYVVTSHSTQIISDPKTRDIVSVNVCSTVLLCVADSCKSVANSCNKWRRRSERLQYSVAVCCWQLQECCEQLQQVKKKKWTSAVQCCCVLLTVAGETSTSTDGFAADTEKRGWGGGQEPWRGVRPEEWVCDLVSHVSLYDSVNTLNSSSLQNEQVTKHYSMSTVCSVTTTMFMIWASAVVVLQPFVAARCCVIARAVVAMKY